MCSFAKSGTLVGVRGRLDGNGMYDVSTYLRLWGRLWFHLTAEETAASFPWGSHLPEATGVSVRVRI